MNIIDYASNGAANLQQLIRDLLSYSRITRAEIKKTRVSMNDLLRELLKNIEMEVKEKNAKVIYGDLLPANADRNLLMLIMQNLVLNGIKYNRSMLPEVKITSEQQEKKIIFRMVDNGIGIEEKHRQKIFEPFQRLHTKAEFSGTGLGLAICKKIVERLGGEIWVEGGNGHRLDILFLLAGGIIHGTNGLHSLLQGFNHRCPVLPATLSIAYSLRAVIVSGGLTPRLHGITDPSKISISG